MIKCRMMWKKSAIFKNSKQKFIQTLWSTCLHKLIYLRLMYKIFSQISHLHSFNVFQLNYNENENANPKKNLRSTIKNFIREKEACFKQICKSANEKSRREKTWSNVTSSNPTCPPPRLFHHHRFKDGISIDGTILRSSSNHRKRKEGEGKKVALSTTSLAKRWWYRNGGARG